MQARTRLASLWSGRLTPREKALAERIKAEIAAGHPHDPEVLVQRNVLLPQHGFQACGQRPVFTILFGSGELGFSGKINGLVLFQIITLRLLLGGCSRKKGQGKKQHCKKKAGLHLQAHAGLSVALIVRDARKVF